MFATNTEILPTDGQYPRDALRVSGDGPDGLAAYPVDGGPVYRFNRQAVEKFGFRAVTDTDRVPSWRPGRFGFDDMEPWAGFTTGRLWNGWARPAFTFETAAALTRFMEDLGGRFDPTLDAFVFGEGEERFECRAVETPAGKLYDFGDAGWTFNDMTNEEAHG
jgi:hypothetical protein